VYFKCCKVTLSQHRPLSSVTHSSLSWSWTHSEFYTQCCW